MLRMAICDDEDYVCSSLERYIMACCASMLIDCEIDIYTTGEGFIKKLKSDNSYHLIFLDIELKKCSGIDVSEYIRNTLHNETMQIAYVSGKDGYDRQLFTFRPFHFIDKPFDQHSITVVIEKYLRIYGNKSDIFQYKVGHDKYWVKIEDIMYFKSNDRKVIIRTMTNEDEFYGAIENVAEQVKGLGFLTPHKSYLINYRYIRSFQHDVIILINGTEIPVSKSKRKDIAKAQILLENGGNFHVH